MVMRKVMTIAGSDSGGGAGIQADLKAIAAMGAYGTTAITSVTVQNTLGVKDVCNLPLEIVEAQIDAIMEDISAHAAKTGMLATKEIILLVSRKIKEYKIDKLVVDPVMVATSGDILLESNAIETLIQELLPLAEVVTPNIQEAEVLSGITIHTIQDMERAAEKIGEMGSKYVIVKGGHRAEDATDILYDGKEIFYFPAERINTNNTHGTGCTYSAALAACIAQGMSMTDAVGRVKQYITGGIINSLSIGKGSGPVDHFWMFEDKGER
jgi:hydroxymethylpyrimidine/phosphomethylpyrimidine kinase